MAPAQRTKTFKDANSNNYTYISSNSACAEHNEKYPKAPLDF